MAIIGAGAAFALEAMVIPQLRPALLIQNGWIFGEAPEHWEAILSQNRPTIERAIRGTARLETSDGTLPYLGTAFMVGPGLAVTARHVANSMRSRGPGAGAPPSCWLNFGAEHGSDESTKVPISSIARIHPRFDCALLELESDVEPQRILPLATASPPPETDICVIGYPSFDVRNDREVQSAIFKDIYGVKRLMPGKVMESKTVTSFGNEVLSLTHDATTMGGTGGAPVIVLNTGQVAGLNFAGLYLVGNYAVPAQEIRRLVRYEFDESRSSPPIEQTESSEEDAPRNLIGGALKSSLVNIFNIDQITALHEDLIGAGFAREDEDLRSLFDGLPVDFQASLPSGKTPSDKLLSRLRYLNRFGALIEVENHTPFYVLLMTARSLRRVEPHTVATIERYIAQVKTVEARAEKERRAP
jgi:hypothetical protein